MKSVLISIKPKWCEMIANGKKTVEFRKTVPKISVPFKCYIYCTKAKNVFDEFFTDPIEQDLPFGECGNGKVIGEFICDNVYFYERIYGIEGETDCIYNTCSFDEKYTCLTDKQMGEYGKGKQLFGWHISVLKIYDTPKELSNFLKPCPYGDVSCFLCDKSGYNADMHIECFNTVDRPPQSWCYVEGLP